MGTRKKVSQTRSKELQAPTLGTIFHAYFIRKHVFAWTVWKWKSNNAIYIRDPDPEPVDSGAYCKIFEFTTISAWNLTPPPSYLVFLMRWNNYMFLLNRFLISSSSLPPPQEIFHHIAFIILHFFSLAFIASSLGVVYRLAIKRVIQHFSTPVPSKIRTIFQERYYIRNRNCGCFNDYLRVAL